MKVYLTLAAISVLAGCSGETAPPAPPSLAASDVPEMPVIGAEVPILALGDSLFAGHGLKPGEAYPAVLERALRARGINARIANSGVSGNTTADAVQRLAFTLDSQKTPPALVLICLGGNDMLRGLPPEAARENLDTLLTELDRRGIPAVLMGMLAPPNLGADYQRRFNAIYPQLARSHDVALVPFFLQAVIGKPDLIQPDRLHPTAGGVEAMVAATVDTVTAALKVRSS
jgi:acyl-CoA thioesterase I